MHSLKWFNIMIIGVTLYIRLKCSEKCQILGGNPTDRFGNYLFGEPLILSDFLERTVASNFRDMRNLMSVCCFRNIKNVVLATEKRSAIIFEKAIRPKVFVKWTKKP